MKESSITVNILQDNKGLGKIPVFPKTVQGNRVTSLNIIPILSKWNHNRHIANLKFHVFYPPIRRWSDKLWFKKITRSTHKAVLCLLFFFLSWNAGYGQDVVYVSPDGTGDGSSWGQASSLADAVDNASAGDEIWLRQGTYTITQTLEATASNLHIYGGFDGTEIALNERDWQNNGTILDGLGERRILIVNYNNITVDGVTFLNGFIEGQYEGGGAIYTNSGAILRNCAFQNNISEGSRGAGAVFSWGSSSDNLLIDNCLFENNRTQNYVGSANGGGAIHIWTNGATIQNSTFRNNTSHNAGGAVFTWSRNNVSIEDCVFENNRSDEAGGAIHTRSILSLSNIEFTGNRSGNNGGAVHNGEEMTLQHTIFTGNAAEGNGGAIHNGLSSTVTITNAVFNNNQSGNGGAIYNDDELSLSNSLFNNNVARIIGGAIYNNEELYVTNSTFVSNTNTAIVHPYRESSAYDTFRTHIFNSIFYNNTAGIVNNTDLWPDVDRNSNLADQSERDFSRNIFQENTNGTNNLIGVDPLFQGFSSGDFSLQDNSPAVEYGRNNLYTNVRGNGPGMDNDLAGNDRLFGAYVDAGAYELQSTSTLTPPGCATNVMPVNNATDVSLLPTIQWDAVTNATGYLLTIGTTATGGEVLNNEDVGNVTSYTVTTELEENTAYYIHVVPYNNVGEATGCSEISFTTETLSTIPNCTSITAPTNGAEDVALDADITWNAVDGADGYRIFIGTSPGGSDIVNGEEVTGTSYSVVSGFEENTTYYVSVVPFNAVGEATGCSEISFTTETLPAIPDCTSITAPANGAEDAALDADITWNAVDGADGYRIFIGTSPGGSDIVNGEEVTGTSYSVVGGFEENTTYYVSVVPFNSVGDATDCMEITFTTLTTALAPITGLSFLDGSFVYDGTEHTLSINGTPPTGAVIDYATNGRVDVGEQTVTVTVSAPGYETLVLEAGLEITPAPLVIRADPHNKTYGENDPPLTYTYDGLADGDTDEVFTGRLAREVGEDIGGYQILQGDLSAGGNYTINFVGATFTIEPAIIEGLSFEDGNFVYDGTEHHLAISGPLPPNASVNYSNNGRTDAGVQTVTVTVSAPNYQEIGVEAVLEITPAPLSISADPYTKLYGSPDPEWTYNADGLVGGDVINGALSREPGEEVGEYIILQGTLSAGGNYEMNFIPGQLSIYRGVDAMHVPDAPLEIYGNEQLSVHIQIQNIWTVAYERGDEVVLRLDAGAGLDIVRVESADLDIIQQYGVWVLRPTGIWEPSAFRHLEITLAGNGVDEDSSSLYIAVWNPQNMGAQADVGLQLDVLVEQGIEELVIPNVFTPNGDGINDRFEITGLRSYDYVKLLVVNQFGVEIYRNENYQNMWMAPGIIDGTYYYLVQAYRGWEKREYRGYVLIKRQ